MSVCPAVRNADANSFSAINQTIALKTIQKLGFSANAVWNGKEALEYIVEASSPTHPKPDIVLSEFLCVTNVHIISLLN